MVDEEFEVDLDKVTDEVKAVKPKTRTELQTQEQLQHALAEELKALLSKVISEDDDDEEKFVPFNVYEQLSPFRESEEEDSPFPYCVVKFDSSRVNNTSQREEVNILLDFGIYYDNIDRQYQHVFYHIYNIIRRRFLADNFLANFRCSPEMTLALTPTDEDTYPYYFAGIGMRWEIPGIDREVDFWNQGGI